MIAAYTCTKLGDVLMNPKTILTWVLTALGSPGAVIAMLVPIRESGSMLPQLIISSWVKQVRQRKHIFVAGCILQALAVAAMGLSAMLLPPTAAGWCVLLALTVFSIARAFCSISSTDVMGRSIPKGFRGRVSGLSATLSGFLSAIAAVMLVIYRDEHTITVLAWLLFIAAFLWLIGAGIYSSVHEPVPTQTDAPATLSNDLRNRLRLVLDDKLFAQFILCRCLLLGSALASPLLVVLGQQSGGSLISLVGFVIASGLASGTSSFFWGKLADQSGSLTMALGGTLSTIIGFTSLAIALWAETLTSLSWCWPLLFLLFNLGYAGVRIGRSTWVVDAVDGDKRTDYVSASNTLIAICIIVMGLITSALHSLSPLIPLGLYCLLCVVGAGVALKIHQQQKNADSPPEI